MKLIEVSRDMIRSQVKGSPLLLQFGYTGIFLMPGLLPGWSGSTIGLFTPRKTGNGYSRTGFIFRPWLARDIAVCRLNRTYVRVMNAISFRLQ